MYRRRKYKLVNLDNSTELILDDTGDNNTPVGSNDNEATIKKSTKNFSITVEYSGNLEFANNGASFLRSAYDVKREEANVQMYEYRINPTTDVEELFYVGTFDFYDFVRDDSSVLIPFKSGGLTSLVNSKYSTKYELNRETSIDDEEIEPITKDRFASTVMPIELNTLLEASEDDEFSDAFRMEFDGGDPDYRYGFLSLPLDITYESDDDIKGIPSGLLDTVYLGADVNYFSAFNQASQLFIYNASRDKTLNVNLSTSFNSDYITNENTENRYGALVLLKYTGEDNPECILSGGFAVNGDDNLTVLKDLTYIFDDYSGTKQVDYSEVMTLNIEKGCSYAFGVLGGGRFINFNPNNKIKLKINLEDIQCSIKINEYSIVNEYSRVSDMFFNKNVGEQLTRILTGQSNRYYSEYLSTGEGKYTALCSGKMIRGFQDETLTTSLKDYLENTQCLMCMGWNIENINGVDTLVHEPLKHFFRQEFVIDLGAVNKLKRTPAKDLIYSEASVGYKKPDGDNLYEEVNGLLEVNTENTYTTPIKKHDNEFDLVSPYRADSNGKELTYRQHITVNPDGDYRTDNTIFNIDAKESGTTIYEEKTYESYYSTVPYTNGDLQISSPQTLTGLNFTPFRNFQRWFWFINGGLTAQTENKVLYSSTIGNSTLVTKKEGEEPQSENGKYLVKDMETPRFYAEWLEFEYEIDYDTATLLKGKTRVNGRDIPNIYFKVRFINEFNKYEYGYLFELKPNKTGQWKLLRAF